MRILKVSFFRFFKDYIKNPLIISLNIHFVLLVSVFVVWLFWLKFPAEREQELYGALRDKYNNNGSTADILSQMLKLEYEISKEKGTEELIRALHKNFGGMLFCEFETTEHFFNFSADLIASYPNIKIDKISIISFAHSAIFNNGTKIDYLSDVIWDKKQNVLKILRKDAGADKIKAEIPEFGDWFVLWSEMLAIFFFFNILVFNAYYKKLIESNSYELIFEIPSSKLWFSVILVSVSTGLIFFISIFAFAYSISFLFGLYGSKRKNKHIENSDLKILEKNDGYFSGLTSTEEIYLYNKKKLKDLRNLKKKQRELRKKMNLEENLKIFTDFKKESELKALDEKINNLRSRLEQKGTELGKMQREYFAEKAKKEKLEKEPKIADENLIREFEKILSLPEVEAMEILEDRIKIYTGTVRKIYGKNRIYIFGDYVINLSHNNGKLISEVGGNGLLTSPKIENLTSTHFNGKINPIHPYVFDDGRFQCLGDATMAISCLLNKQELYAAIVNIVRILYFYEVLRANPLYKIEEWRSVEISPKKAREILEKHKKQKEAANGLS